MVNINYGFKAEHHNYKSVPKILYADGTLNILLYFKRETLKKMTRKQFLSIFLVKTLDEIPTILLKKWVADLKQGRGSTDNDSWTWCQKSATTDA